MQNRSTWPAIQPCERNEASDGLTLDATEMQAIFDGSGVELVAHNLFELSQDETQRDGIIAADGHLGLIWLLRAGADSKTTEHAAQALMKLSFQSTERKLRLVQAGVVDPVVALLRSAPMAGNQVVLANVASLVSRLCLTSAGLEAFQKAGAITLLVQLLGAAPTVATAAAGALWNLSFEPETKQTVNITEIREAGAIPPLVALLHGATASTAAGALHGLATEDAGAAAIRSAGAIVPLVALLHAAEAETAESAACALNNLGCNDQQSRPAIPAALAARLPPPPHDDRPKLTSLLTYLQPTATERLIATEAGDDAAALQQAIDQAAAVRVADAVLQPARTKLAAGREAAEAVRRERRTSLGLDELKTPDEFVCPITYEVMQDPVCASDGHTYERSAIEEVLALPEARRRSPLTREALQAVLFPNRALKNRIAAHGQEVEAAVEKAMQKAEAERTSASSRKRPPPAGAEVIKLEDDSSDEGASSSSAPAGGGKRGRRM